MTIRYVQMTIIYNIYSIVRSFVNRTMEINNQDIFVAYRQSESGSFLFGREEWIEAMFDLVGRDQRGDKSKRN